ncbi:MAG: hypothetical protein JST96_00205 [Bacteroidetes bacterium]|nr:hypothetical protein [Bacteroidota bacterium]
MSLINQLLKWAAIIYVGIAFPIMLYKLGYLFVQHRATSKEVLMIGINIVIFLALVRQLFKLNQVKYIIVTDQYVKYRQEFPWASVVNWKNVKQIQFGYSSVRFITKKNKKLRFSLSKTTGEDRTKLSDSFNIISKKYDVELLLPI